MPRPPLATPNRKDTGLSETPDTSDRPSEDLPSEDQPAVDPQGNEPPVGDSLANEETLAEAVATCGLEITPEQLAKLDAYRNMMWAWNEKLNLTRHTTIEKFVTRDLVDTIELSKLLEPGEKVLDIGSGGGVPGIPLAILRPDLDLRICESVAKKANVLADMIERLELPVTLYASRVEAVVDKRANTPRFDTLIARAVAPLWKFMFWLAPHNQGWTRLLLIKGPSWTNERGEARHRGLMKGFDLRRVGEYLTPRTDATTTLLCVTRRAPEPPGRGPKPGPNPGPKSGRKR